MLRVCGRSPALVHIFSGSEMSASLVLAMHTEGQLAVSMYRCPNFCFFVAIDAGTSAVLHHR